MRGIFENLQLYRQYVLEHPASELFVSSSKCYYVECTSSFIDIQERTQEGISKRVFLKDHTDFSYVDGISINSFHNIISQAQNVISLPKTTMIPSTLLNNHVDFNKISISVECELNKEKCLQIWRDVSKYISSKGEKIHKMYIQYQRDFYLLVSKNSDIGYSERTVFSPGFQLCSSPACIYNIFPSYKDSIEYDKFFDISHSIDVPELTDCNKKIDYILLSDAAIIKLIFFLLFTLSKDTVLSNMSIFNKADLGKKLFSECINVEENSSSNKIILGDTDGEGMPRTPRYIIKQGIMKCFFSDYSPESGFDSTGSSFRFSHFTPPRVQPSKVAIIGNSTLGLIRDKYDRIAQLYDIVGIEESFDPKTTSFEAYAIAHFYVNGRIASRFKVNIKSSIIKILNNVLCIADDGKYGADGSIFCGSFLIENNHIIL